VATAWAGQSSRRDHPDRVCVNGDTTRRESNSTLVAAIDAIERWPQIAVGKRVHPDVTGELKLTYLSTRRIVDST
jgi:hypothetical protein